MPVSGPGSGSATKQFVADPEAGPVGAADRAARRDRQPDGARPRRRSTRCPPARARATRQRQARLERPPRRVARAPLTSSPSSSSSSPAPRARRRPLPRPRPRAGAGRRASPTRPPPAAGRRLGAREAQGRGPGGRRRRAVPRHDAHRDPARGARRRGGGGAGSSGLRDDPEARGALSRGRGSSSSTALSTPTAPHPRPRSPTSRAERGARGAGRLRHRRRARRRPLSGGDRGPHWRERRRARRGRCARRSGSPRCSAAASTVAACELLLIRARADLDAGRTREAALQLRVGLEALLAEREALAAPDQDEDLAALDERRDDHRRGGERGARAASSSEAAPPRSPRRSRSASASCGARRTLG